MFRLGFQRVPDAFKLIIEYGPSHLEYDAPSRAQVRLPQALATLEVAWNSDESEASVVERLAARKSALVLERMEERVVLSISVDPTPHAATFPDPRLLCALRVAPSCPALRTIHLVRTSASGTASAPLLAALLKHCELRGVWKLKGGDGFGNFWATCVEVAQWEAVRNLNLSYSNLPALPGTIGELRSLQILRLSHNRLSALPPELGRLSELQVLAVDHNQLTSVPGGWWRARGQAGARACVLGV